MSSAKPEPAASGGGAARLALPRAPWRWAAILGVAVALLAVGIVASRGGSAGSPSTPTGASGAGGTALNGAGSGGSGGSGGGSHGSGGAAGATATAHPGGAGSSSGASGAKSSPTPKGSPYAMPTPAGDQVVAKADINSSTCPGGYPPNTTCKVYVQGIYYLVSQPAGKLIVEVLIDGSVAYSQSYSAPAGERQFGSLMQFQVPQNAKEVDYEAILQDVTGKTLATSKPYVTYVR